MAEGCVNVPQDHFISDVFYVALILCGSSF